MQSELIQNTPEWLTFRQKKIGASDAPIIMGVSPWKTPYQLWVEKTTGTTTPMSSHQKRGQELEETARQVFEKQMGSIMFPKVVLHPTFEWMMASLDGIDLEGKSIVEIKCPGNADHEIAKDGRIPEKYYPQLQHQLAVTGLDMAFYFSYDGEEGIIVEVYRDNDFIAELIDKEQEFWKCLSTSSPPPMNDRDYLHREDEAWTEISQKWLNVHRQLELLEKEEKELRNQLVQMADAKNVTGGGVRLSRSIRKGNVQYNQIPELQNVDLEQYRKEPIEVWRLVETK